MMSRRKIWQFLHPRRHYPRDSNHSGRELIGATWCELEQVIYNLISFMKWIFVASMKLFVQNVADSLYWLKSITLSTFKSRRIKQQILNAASKFMKLISEFPSIATMKFFRFANSIFGKKESNNILQSLCFFGRMQMFECQISFPH